MIRDNFDNMEIRPVIAPVVVSDNTAQVGASIDHAGRGAATYVISTGTLVDADATFAVLLQESPDNSTWTTVADADTVGTQALANFDFSFDGKCRKLGYVGKQRYTRLTITPAANTGSAPLAALCVLGHPRVAPQSAQ